MSAEKKQKKSPEQRVPDDKATGRLHRNKRLVYGSYSFLLIALVVAVVILANVGVTALENSLNLKIDMTQNRLYSISDQTRKVASELQQPVEVYTLFETGGEDDLTLELLNRYAALSDKIVLSNVDPVRNPGFVTQFNPDNDTISNGSIIVTNADHTKYRVLQRSTLFSYDSNGNITMSNIENKVTSAIMYLNNDNATNIFFLQGHGEPTLSQVSKLKNALEGENYNVTTINLLTEPEKITSKDVLVVMAPQKDVDSNEREIIKTLMSKGGNLIFAFDPTVGELENFNSLLELYGIERTSGVVMEADRNNYIVPYANYLLPNYGEHEILDALKQNGYPVAMPTAGELILPDAPVDRYTTLTPLLTTSADSWLREDLSNSTMTKMEGEKEGPFTVGVLVERQEGDAEDTRVRMAIFNSVNFMTMNESLSSYANGDMVLNAMNWMTGTSNDFYIRGKTLASPILLLTSGAQLYTLIIILGPVLVLGVLAIGVVVYLRRRHR